MNHLRHIPAVHMLKNDARFLEMLKRDELCETSLTNLLKEQIDVVREQIIHDEFPVEIINEETVTTIIFNLLNEAVNQFNKNNLQNVINATGVVLHTNLGRACLSEKAIEQLVDIAAHYSTLEYNIETGARGSRHDIVETYLTTLTGAEAAIVVNNNAAAVYLVLKAIGAGKEAIISRGELVEIGGSFRISDIMEESDVQIVEVGTTNKTKLTDYEQAITDETGLLLKVHKSNFKMIGFTEEVETEQLVELSNKYGIPTYEDLGSGTLFNFTDERIGNEPTVKQQVNKGIQLISFSGDKLLGGPQAGIVVGKKCYIDQLKKHQLARVLRVDKFTLSALEATLKTYIRGKEKEEIPVIRDLLKESETVKQTALTFINQIEKRTEQFTYDMIEETSQVGGGTMPGVHLQTFVVRVVHNKFSSEQLAKRLRKHDIPIIVRLKGEAILLDFRTINEAEMEIVVEAFVKIEQ